MTIRTLNIESLSLILILLVSEFIKNIFKLHCMPGSIPIPVQMVLHGDNRIVCRTAGRQSEAKRFLAGFGQRVSSLSASVPNR